MTTAIGWDYATVGNMQQPINTSSDGAIYAVMLVLCARNRGYSLRSIQNGLAAVWNVLGKDATGGN